MKRLRLILIIVALLVVGWLVFRPARPKEPSYQGKRLTEWLEYLDQSSFGPRTYPSFSRRQSATTEEYKTAKRAIQSIGTNAIPTLLRIMADRDSPVAIQLEHWVHRLGWKRFNITDWHRKYMLAFSGITLLDRNPAVIEIIRQLEVGSKSSRIAAYICLCSLMPDKEVAFPPLNRLVNGSDPDLAAMAAAIIKQLYPEDAEKAGINQRFPESMFSESDRPSTNAPVAK